MLPFQLKTFLSVRRTAAMGSCGPTWCGLGKPWIPACSRRWRRSWIFVTSAWSSGPRPWCILRPCSPRRSRPEESRSRSSTWRPLLPPTGSGSTSRAPAGPRCHRRWRDTRRRSSPEPWITSGVSGAAGAGGAQRGAGGLEAAAGLVRTAIKAGPPPLSCFVCARIPRGGPGLGGCPGARHSPAEGGSGSGAGGAGAAAMARRQKAKEAKAAAAGKRRAPAALPSPASSSEDEAPEEVPFGVAREAAEAERKLVGEAARRHRELLKEKRRRHQELFAEQKKRRLLPEAVLQELQELQDVSARPAEQAAADDPVTLGEELEAEAVELEQGQAEVQEKKGKRRKGARTNRNYVAVCLKDHSATGLHQQLAKDFLNAQLYGPHTNRVPANEFFSLANKRAPVKKAAVQFVDKSWGQDKKEKAARFKKRWLATHIKNGV
ncbi:uncharacterized protein LOC129127060 isoform X1 [Agelaius phoeniceus]|uniref:uncharacterized protein LOC129127060 isoform X1 n=1 Tax=Agelaius phoeniceus TaxID=39638 RepID=UPI004054AC06